MQSVGLPCVWGKTRYSPHMDALRTYIAAVAEGEALPTESQWASIVRLAGEPVEAARPTAIVKVAPSFGTLQFSTDKLRAAIQAKATSPHKLTKDAGLTDGYVNDLLRGKVRHPSFRRVTAIARTLGVETDDLFEEIHSERQAYASRLRDALTREGRSQTALAQFMGIDQSAVNRIVHGLRSVKVDEASRIEAYLAETAS